MHLNEPCMKWELLKDSHGFPKRSLWGSGTLCRSVCRKEDECFVRRYSKQSGFISKPKQMAMTSLTSYSCKASSSICRTQYAMLASFWDLCYERLSPYVPSLRYTVGRLAVNLCCYLKASHSDSSYISQRTFRFTNRFSKGQFAPEQNC